MPAKRIYPRLPGARPLGTLLDVRRARRVVLHDVWIGLSALAPLVASYDLVRSASGGLAGEARFSVARRPPKIVRLALRAATVDAWLRALASARLAEGPYVPLQNHTDDYPRLDLELHVDADRGAPGGVARLHSESQGRFHAPWGAEVGGRAFVVEGDAVGRALRGMDRALKKGELRRLAGW